MKRGTERNAVLRNDRKVISPVDSFLFWFCPVRRSGFRSGFFVPGRFGKHSCSSSSLLNTHPYHTFMNDNTLAPLQ